MASSPSDAYTAMRRIMDDRFPGATMVFVLDYTGDLDPAVVVQTIPTTMSVVDASSDGALYPTSVLTEMLQFWGTDQVENPVTGPNGEPVWAAVLVVPGPSGPNESAMSDLHRLELEPGVTVVTV